MYRIKIFKVDGYYQILIENKIKGIGTKYIRYSIPDSNNTDNLGFEEKLWKMADKLRNNMMLLSINMLFLVSLQAIILDNSYSGIDYVKI